jgi:hypothetical protein
MSVGRPMGLESSPCSYHQERSATLSSGSKEPYCHLEWTQASDSMQKLQHPGRVLVESWQNPGKSRFRQVRPIVPQLGAFDASDRLVQPTP